MRRKIERATPTPSRRDSVSASSGDEVPPSFAHAAASSGSTVLGRLRRRSEVRTSGSSIPLPSQRTEDRGRGVLRRLRRRSVPARMIVIDYPPMFFIQMVFAMCSVNPPPDICDKGDMERIRQGVEGVGSREGAYQKLGVHAEVREHIDANPILRLTISTRAMDGMIANDAKYAQFNVRSFPCYELVYNTMIHLIRTLSSSESELRGEGDIESTKRKLDFQAYIMLSMLEIMIKTMGYQRFPEPMDVRITLGIIQAEKDRIEGRTHGALIAGVKESIDRREITLISHEITVQLARGTLTPLHALHTARYLDAINIFFCDVIRKFEAQQQLDGAVEADRGPIFTDIFKRIEGASSVCMLCSPADMSRVEGLKQQRKVAVAIGRELARNAPEVFMLLKSSQRIGMSSSGKALSSSHKLQACVAHFMQSHPFDTDIEIEMLAASIRVGLQIGDFKIEIEDQALAR